MCTGSRCVGALGSAVVTGDKDGWLHVWDMDLGQVSSQLHAHKGTPQVSVHARVCVYVCACAYFCVCVCVCACACVCVCVCLSV